MIAVVEERRAQVGVAPLCDALGLARATFYRRRRGPPAPRMRRAPRQALTPADRAAVLALLHEEQFVDLPPAQVWAHVLDAGQVPPCSIRTMYRILGADAEVRERRNQPRQPHSGGGSRSASMTPIFSRSRLAAEARPAPGVHRCKPTHSPHSAP
jgi:putative transposase